MSWTWNEKNVAAALNIKAGKAFSAKRVTTDSRHLEKGDLFVALKGENFNGNKFAEEALKKGAVAAIVDEDVAGGERLIKVDDALKALQKLGKYKRKNSNAKFVAVTGSVGKTGTKEMIHAALSTKYKTFKTAGNLNNHIGLPLTLANMPDDIDYAVIELGMNHAGEIGDLVRICRPDIAAITWVSEAHIENLGSVENIAKAKAEIFEWMGIEGKAVIPADNAYYEILREAAEANGITDIYCFGEKADAVVKNKAGVSAHVADTEIEISTELLQKQVLNNILLALTIAGICEADIKKALAAMEGMKEIAGRGGSFEHKSGALIIDDSYNASPESMKLALRKLFDVKAKRKLAALGDMRELGKFSKKYHEELADYVTGFDMVITCGKDMKMLHDKVKDTVSAKHFTSVDECLDFISAELKKGDALLIKGSHGSDMWKMIDKLKP